MSTIGVAPELSRNLGFWSAEEQRAMSNSVVAIAGAGGDGGALAEQLARAGVGEIRLADPDPFEVENINRQAFCNTETVGRNKADVVAEGIQLINPRLNVVKYIEGVNVHNIDEFVRGADLVIDETEFTMHQVGVMIARAARSRRIPDLMALNIGFGATVTTFLPDGPSLEEMLGIPEDMPLDEVAEHEVPLDRWLPYIPPYADLEMFQKVAAGEVSAPSVGPGVAMAASMAAVQAQLHLVGGANNHRPSPVAFRQVRVMDAMTGEAFTVTDPLVSHRETMAEMVSNNFEGKVPRVVY